MSYKHYIAAILFLLVVVFAVQNAAIVEIRLLFWEVTFPRSLLIFLMLLIGMAIGWITRSIFKVTRTK